MLPISKTVVAITAQSVTNAATVTGNIDRIGFNYCELDVLLAGGNSATNNPSVLNIGESDDTVVTNFANITGLVGDTGFTIPDIGTDTAATTVVKFRLDLKKRKRFLRVTISPITTELLSAVAQLHKWEKAPVGTTDAGVATVVDL